MSLYLQYQKQNSMKEDKKKTKLRLTPDTHGQELELNLEDYNFQVEGSLIKAIKKQELPEIKEPVMPSANSVEYALLQLVQLRNDWYAQNGAPDWQDSSRAKHVITFRAVGKCFEVMALFTQCWTEYHFLAFNTHSEAVEFYDKYRDLIEKLKDFVIWRRN